MKELLIGKIINVRQSYNNLGIDMKQLGPDGVRAIEDMIENRECREELFFKRMKTFIPEKRRESLVSEELLMFNIDQLQDKNAGFPEYFDVSRKLLYWFKDGFFDCGITGGEKLAFLKNQFGIKNEIKAEIGELVRRS